MAQALGEAVAPLGPHGPDAAAGQQYERVMAATIELVADRGYRNTSIDQIVKSAQVGYVTFYDLFGSKEDCFLAAFDQIVAATTKALAIAVEPVGSWRQQITAALRCLLHLVVADPDRARIVLVEAQAVGPRARARYEEAVAKAIPKLKEGRTLDQRLKTLSPYLEETVLGGLLWVIHQRLVERDLGETETLLDETSATVLSPYVGG